MLSRVLLTHPPVAFPPIPDLDLATAEQIEALNLVYRTGTPDGALPRNRDARNTMLCAPYLEPGFVEEYASNRCGGESVRRKCGQKCGGTDAESIMGKELKEQERLRG